MPNHEIVAKIAETQKEIMDHVMVRGKVFIIEQAIDWAIEFDGLDHECVLFVAYFDGKPAGSARLHKNKVGRVATLEPYRKQGVARAIMESIEIYARKHHIPLLTLHAQLYVKEVYERLGYVPKGDIFKEAGIDHVYMEKQM